MIARLWNQIRGRISLFFSGLEFRNPEVLLENARNDLQKNRVKMREGLANLAANSEALRRQVTQGKARQQDLENRVMTAYQAGRTDLAEELAGELASVEADNTENEREFAQNEQAYKQFAEMCQTVEKDLLKKMERYQRALAKAKATEAAADVSEMLSGTVSQTNAASTNMERLGQVIDEKGDKAAGRMRAATDSGQFQEIKLKQQENEMRKKTALASFLAKKGVAATAPATGSAAAPATPTTPERPTLG